MPIHDKVAAANKISELLQAVITHTGLRLKYRITVDPPAPHDRDWETPEIFVEFAGPDSAMLLNRGGELMRALELLSLETLRVPGHEHEKVIFDCENFRSLRLEELRAAAKVAADKVRSSGIEYRFAPMSSRERRMVHLALRDFPDLHTESDGEGARRAVVVLPGPADPNARRTRSH